MSACDTLARRICGDPGVFTSKEAAEKCANNTEYRLLYSLQFSLIGLIIAVFLFIGLTSISGKHKMIVSVIVGMLCVSLIATFTLYGYRRSAMVPINEQKADEIAIKNLMTSEGLTRELAIGRIKATRETMCITETIARNAQSRNNFGSSFNRPQSRFAINF